MRYREDRAAQAAARLLKLRGGRMAYMKLLKLLYLADREALVSLGRPITYDRMLSMPHGPVLSRTYDLMASEPDPNETSYWHRYISPPGANYEVELVEEAPADQLSRAEEQILEDVFKKFGHMRRWELRDYTHGLPEYQDPKGSSLPIIVADLLRSAGIKEEEIEAIQATLWDEAAVHSLVA
jgi:uncharacterized phage-associated protein